MYSYILLLIVATGQGGISQSTTEFVDKDSCEFAKQTIIDNLQTQTEKSLYSNSTIKNVKSYCIPHKR
jgi:hypothetical protein